MLGQLWIYIQAAFLRVVQEKVQHIKDRYMLGDNDLTKFGEKVM